jgi:hypothetical protein
MRRFVCGRRRCVLGSAAMRSRARPVSMPARPRIFLACPPFLERACPLESSFRSAASSSECLRFEAPLAGLSTRALPTRGFGPHRDITLLRLHSAKKLPTFSLRSVLRRSQPRDGFLRKRACRLISSRSRVQDLSCSGNYSLRAAVLSRRKSAHAPLPLALLSLIGRPISAISTPRLRGFSPREGTWRAPSGEPVERSFPSSGSLLLQVPLSPTAEANLLCVVRS